jgi:hypothetical protein
MKITKKTILFLLALFTVFLVFSEIGDSDSQNIIQAKASAAADFPTNI